MSNCWLLEANVLIKKFDNRKAVGFVTNYDTASQTGLFFGLYDNGNSDAMTLSTFDATTGKLTGTVANAFLGSKIKENVWYELYLNICTGADFITGLGSVVPAASDGVTGIACPEVADQSCLPISGPLPDGINPVGAAGIAGQAKSSFVDSSVRNLEVRGTF